VQPGGTRREVPGSDGLPQVRKDPWGTRACQESSGRARRSGRCVAGPAEYGESWIARSPISSDASRHPPERRLNRCRALRRRCGFAGATFGVRAMPSEGIQGDEWATYVPLDTYNKDERGIAYGTRVLGRRRSGSSRRSHDLPRRTGKPSTGRSRPGDRTPPRREVDVMPNVETVRGVPRGAEWEHSATT